MLLLLLLFKFLVLVLLLLLLLLLPLTMLWKAKPGCPAHRRPIIEKTVRGFPAAWLVPPVSGEVFDSKIDYKRRLRGFSFTDGFDIVRKGGSSKKSPG